MAVWHFLHLLGPNAQTVWRLTALLYVAAMLLMAWRGSGSERTFVGIMALGILVLRLPNCILFELNPDESQWIAGAATLLRDPRFWLSVDGTTSGPLVMFPLCGLPVLNYATARLLAVVLCAIPSVLLLYAGFVHQFGRPIARPLVLPMAVFMATTNYWNFVAYSSECVPMLLVAVASYLFLKGGTPSWEYHRPAVPLQGSTTLAATALGVVVGLSPYAKLQVVPIMLVIAVFYLRREPGRRAAFVSALFFPTLLVAVYLTVAGAWTDFWQSYVAGNLWYVQSGVARELVSQEMLEMGRATSGMVGRLLLPFYLLAMGRDLAWFLLPLLACCLLWGRGTLFGLCCLVAAYCAVAAPGKLFTHYLLLMVVPAFLAAGLCLGRNFSRAHLATFLVAALILPASYTISRGSLGIRALDAPASQIDDLGVPRILVSDDAVSTHVARFMHRGESMAVWGWASYYYVLCGATQGTRDAHAAYQAIESPQQQYFVNRYAADLERNRPAVFLDAVAPGEFVLDHPRQRHECFAAVDRVVQDHYTMVWVHRDMRLYVRNDRLAAVEDGRFKAP